MSVDNIVARPRRDVEPEAGESGFRMPPDLAERYDVRVVPAKDPNDVRMGMFRPGDRGDPSIEVLGNGDRIVARKEDPETVAALVKIAKHNGWEGIDVDGSPEFKKAVWEAGSREGLTVRGYEPSFAEQERMADVRRTDEARREREAAAKPTPVVEQVAPVAAVVAVAAIEATVPARSADVGREAVAEAAPAQGSTELSDVGVIIPNLLDWPDSLVVLDIKQENYENTAGYRKEVLRQIVLLFNPLHTSGRTVRWNPLGYINRRDPVEVINELQKIAAMLYPDPLTGETFWAEGARTAFLGVTAYIAATVDDGENALPFTLGEPGVAGAARRRSPTNAGR